MLSEDFFGLSWESPPTIMVPLITAAPALVPATTAPMLNERRTAASTCDPPKILVILS